MENKAESGRQRVVILVVEDEPIVRFCAAEVLGDAGFGVIEAATGDDALAILQDRSDIAILFTDIEMPGSIDGNALAAAVAARWPAIRIVVTSGRMRPGPQDLPKNAFFLPKPYLPDQLFGAIFHGVESH